MSLPLTPINPAGLAAPRGYSHGMRGTGTLLFVAGQIGWDGTGRLVSTGFVAQFAQALDNVLAVVREAGGEPARVARLTIYVTDKELYRSCLQEIGHAYRERMGRHYPAMALVEVRSLLEGGALVEIEATAVL
ncbi:MAG: RidA family protein [Vicinamibacteria bacterium]